MNSKYTAVIHDCDTPNITPYDVWCVTDFEDNFVLLRLLTNASLNSTCVPRNPESDIIIPINGFDKCKAVWSKFQELQQTECHLLWMRNASLEDYLDPPHRSIVSHCDFICL